jgi:hypothetical protein
VLYVADGGVGGNGNSSWSGGLYGQSPNILIFY